VAVQTRDVRDDVELFVNGGYPTVEYRWTVAGETPSLPDLAAVVFRYMFYYPDDVGFRSHEHDLESVEVTVSLRTQADAVVARVSRIAGAAHGIGWYSNVLDIDPSDRVRLPVRVLVEEGKHASAPDRNGDGVYNPEFDVNTFTRDAWGIRDTMVSRYLPGPAFASHMAKTRVDDSTVWPASAIGIAAAMGRPLYSLRLATAATAGTGAGTRMLCTVGEDLFKLNETIISTQARKTLSGLLEGKNFCDPTSWQSSDYESRARTWALLLDYLPSVAALALATKSTDAGRWNVVGIAPMMFGVFLREARPYSTVVERQQLGVRYDRGRSFVTVGAPIVDRFPGIDGPLIVKYSVGSLGSAPAGSTYNTTLSSADLLYTPSAARFADWYTSIGIDRLDRFARPPDIEEGGQEEIGFTKAAFEFGVRVRFPLPEGWLLPPFIGFRLGLRTSSLRDVETARPILEFGLGAF